MTSKGVILAIEDAPESLIALTDILTAAGYKVLPADSGELALASVAAITPELILLDIRMPGMDGFEVCRRLKASGETHDIPVIFLSAITETEVRVEGLKHGAVDFVSKPFQREELLARIETHLELSRLREHLEQRVAERTERLEAANEQLWLQLEEQIRAEQALRESEARFRSIADSAAAVIWFSDRNLQLTFVNKYALTFTGCTLEEFAGEEWKKRIHPEDLERSYPDYLPLFAARSSYTAEFRLRRADGEYRWMLDTANPRFLPNGDFAGYVGVMLDITDLKRHQEHLLATQRLESLGLLAGGVAHRFGNLLGGILAEADLALSDVAPESSIHENLTRINSLAMQSSQVVGLLAAYAANREDGVLAPVNIRQVVREALELIRITVFSKVTLAADLPGDLPPIRADAAQIRQVVLNLLTNSLESLPNQQGSIRLTASRMNISRENAENDPGSPQPGEYVRLEVTDTGSGIPEETQTRIFDPFYTTKGPGRGLGLAAVQGIVRRRLGGTIKVQSAPGHGSTFKLLLPCFGGEPQQAI